MKYLGYLLKTKRYYAVIIIHFLLCLVIAFGFSSVWKKTVDARTTYSNFTATALAYDSIPETENSYINFERNVAVSLTAGDGTVFNVTVLQFIEDVAYTEKSIINPANVLYGNYSVLSNNEIAIPISLAKEEGVSVGDTVYVGGKQCSVKFIYRDIYRIYRADFYNKQTVVFVGISTLSESLKENYCVFEPSTDMHNRLENINAVRHQLKYTFTVYYVCLTLLICLISTLLILLRRKSEELAFRRMKLYGEKSVYGIVVLIELGYFIPICAMFTTTALIFGFSASLLPCCLSAALMCELGYVIYLCLRAGR